mmetsp:Transcript_20840/g.29852  ORF Transcript_20840/g.29852 Transcript_20840/m.29852 type:complete len:820 (+) Transcript_20840:58-2517(+)
MKMREGVSNISILVLGDEGVGKSSLISTFVSRHFSEQIPKLLTRVHLPPDPLLSDSTTTIVDTHDGDTALQNALSLSASGNKDGKSSSGNESPLSSSTPSPSPSIDIDDKQSAESFLASTVFRNVDAMVLVYDMSREESFNRLEEYWLPLIERCYRGNIPVIIAGNKVDLFVQQQQQTPPSQTTTARSRQQIISLLQRFKFVRQCIKCSAKNVLHVDDIFNKAKVAVIYPIKPLYDLVGERLTPACSRAFTRIFRMFDLDRDGLLSDDELMAFQSKIWGETLVERDVTEWKNALSRHDSIIHRREEASVGSGSQRSEEVIVNDKITLTGFLTIIDIFISQNRLEVPWTALWTLGYDDEMNLHIPESILSSGQNDLDSNNFDPSVWRLNSSEVDFLSSIFYQFRSDGEGMLSAEDLHSIFSVSSTPLPPWGARSKKLLDGCFSLPRIDEEITPPSSLVAGVTFDHEIEEQISADPSPTSLSVSAGGVTISSSPLPSIDVSKTTELDFTVPANVKPLTYLSWMNHWHMFCTLSPSRFRAELFCLGHVGDMPVRSKTHHAAATLPPSISPDGGTQTIFIRALVLGSSDHAKRSIINNLHGIHQECSALNLTHPETSCSVARVMLPKNKDKLETETAVHLIVTEIPSSYPVSEKISLRNKISALLGKQNAAGERVYDVAVLVFDTGDESSWEYAKGIESNLLTENMPRIFIGTRENQRDSLSVCEHQNHCRNMDLEEPLTLSLDEIIEDSSLLRHLVRCTQDESFRSIPHGERHRRLAALKRKCMWFTSVVSVGLVVVFVFRETKKVEKGSWRHYFQRLLPFS